MTMSGIHVGLVWDAAGIGVSDQVCVRREVWWAWKVCELQGEGEDQVRQLRQHG